jgi:hypothetical protein
MNFLGSFKKVSLSSIESVLILSSFLKALRMLFLAFILDFKVF